MLEDLTTVQCKLPDRVNQVFSSVGLAQFLNAYLFIFLFFAVQIVSFLFTFLLI